MLSWGFQSQVNQWSATWRISQSNVGANCDSELVLLLQLPTKIYIWEGLQTEALDKCFQVVAVVVLVILVVLAVFKALPKSGCQHYPQFSWIVVKQTIKRTFWVSEDHQETFSVCFHWDIQQLGLVCLIKLWRHLIQLDSPGLIGWIPIQVKTLMSVCPSFELGFGIWEVRGDCG